ncbi:tRNA-specific 2-thiouridylase [Crucibulum laeve]|uniref:tRNA-5-taurinomethyluridine 2-sulfurtransferase n=1 Tax=Crucibulum laeve TaxID=68775 RepID=A0A5C3LT91_9AGAR|nr:tRNA-specific 2-thiouridylase [Crucibulum laeve]
MSGGVDSSVTAALLARKDYDLSAIFMRNWDTRDESGTDKGCEWEKDWEDVQRVCKKLDIPCKLIDLSREYWNRVFEPCLRQWEMGFSPNPDVWCNKEVKFGALLERLPKAPSYQNAWIATGHYARKTWSESTEISPSRPMLVRPTDRSKDQTYYLAAISEPGLRRAIFPLEKLTKPTVRELAKGYGLPTAERGESMGICFVGEKRKFEDFLSSYIPPNPGPIIDQTNGKKVGEHPGVWAYTIGQNARIAGLAQKMFVSAKDPKSNTVYIVPGSQHASLYATTIHILSFIPIWKDSPPPAINLPGGYRAHVKHRYRMEAAPCTVRRNESGGLDIECDEPQHAVAAGQIAVLYDGDWCIGCGVIQGSS